MTFLSVISSIVLISLSAGLFNKVLSWAVQKDFQKWVATNQGIYSPVDHTAGWIDRARKMWPALLLLTAAQFCFVGFHLTGWIVLAFASGFGIIGFSFWILFDGRYNMKRRTYSLMTWPESDYYKIFTFWYQGSNDPSHPNAYLDGIRNAKVKKLVGLGLSIAGYILSMLNL